MAIDTYWLLRTGGLTVRFTADINPGAVDGVGGYFSSTRVLLFSTTSSLVFNCESPTFDDSIVERLARVNARCNPPATKNVVNPTQCYNLAGLGEACGEVAGAHCGPGLCCGPDNLCGDSSFSCCPAENTEWQYSDNMLSCSTTQPPPPPSPPPPSPPPVSPIQICSNACQNSYYSLPGAFGTTARYGDCDDGGPGAEFSLCALGTDCDDCGPRTTPPPPPSPPLQPPPSPPATLCDNSCVQFVGGAAQGYGEPGRCEDGGTGSLSPQLCALGTDCADCGTRVISSG